MKVSTKFNVGDIVEHIHNSNVEIKKEMESKKHSLSPIISFRVLEIIINICYSNAQISYRLRPLMERFNAKEVAIKDVFTCTEPELRLYKG